MTTQTTLPAKAGHDTATDSATKAHRMSLLNGLFELRAFIALAVLVVVFSLLSDSFLTVTNLITMTKHVAINAIIALGMLLVILKGGMTCRSDPSSDCPVSSPANCCRACGSDSSTPSHTRRSGRSSCSASRWGCSSAWSTVS